jgi:hypothetical protein
VPPSGVVFLADAEIEALEWLRGAAHRRALTDEEIGEFKRLLEKVGLEAPTPAIIDG